MSANFTISKHRAKDTLKIKLKGDFDGSSAWELINTLKESSKKIHKVVIQTDSLYHIFPFGYETFMKNLYMLKQPLHIVSSDNDTGRIVLEFKKRFVINSPGYKYLSCYDA